jgi:hypothetical protein
LGTSTHRLAIYELRFSKYWNYSSNIQQSGASVNYLQEECLIYIRKENAVLGMLLQGIAILFIPFAQEFYQLASISAAGFGNMYLFYLLLHRQQLLIQEPKA